MVLGAVGATADGAEVINGLFRFVRAYRAPLVVREDLSEQVGVWVLFAVGCMVVIAWVKVCRLEVLELMVVSFKRCREGRGGGASVLDV